MWQAFRSGFINSLKLGIFLGILLGLIITWYLFALWWAMSGTDLGLGNPPFWYFMIYVFPPAFISILILAGLGNGSIYIIKHLKTNLNLF